MEKYIFIGNENDPQTKELGIKKGQEYEISFSISYPLLLTIIRVGKKYYSCPYSSVASFRKNWLDIELKNQD